MNIINYEAGRYSTNLFIISNTKQILSGIGVIEIDDNQWQAYCDIAKASMLIAPDIKKYENTHDFFTIDMQCYSDLYLSKNGVLHKALPNWDDLVSEISKLPMQNIVSGNDAIYEVLSISTGRVINIKMSSKLNVSEQFTKHHLASTRLLNIAIPKNSYDSFYKRVTNTNGSESNQLLVVQNTNKDYTLSDFAYVNKPQGELYRIFKRPGKFNLQIRVTEIPKEPGYAEKLILNVTSMKDINKLHGYADTWEDDSYLYVQFIYNVNRRYSVSVNSKSIGYTMLSEHAVRIISRDLLEHAKQLGIVKYQRFIELPERMNVITLDATFSKVYVQEIHPRYWIQSDFKYTSQLLQINLVDKNRKQWVSGEYMFEEMQIDQSVIEPTVMNQRLLRYEANNLHWFMLNANSEVVKSCSEFKEGFFTNCDIRYGITKALQNIDLPYIINGECWFKNHKFTFISNGINFESEHYEGKQFAVVLVHNEFLAKGDVESKIIDNDLYVVLQLSINYNNYFMRTSIVFENGKYMILTYTGSIKLAILGAEQDSDDDTIESFVSTENNELIILRNAKFITESTTHTGSNSIENTYDTVRHIDLYNSRISELMPNNVKNRLPDIIRMGYISSDSRTANNTIDINPPYAKIR